MITDRRSLANLCCTRSRRELSNQVNFESTTPARYSHPNRWSNICTSTLSSSSFDRSCARFTRERRQWSEDWTEGGKNGNTSERSVHSVFYHAQDKRSRAVVLGGVFGGFGGGNQSGKKLNITPEERGRVSVAETLVSRAFGGRQRNGLEGGCSTYSAWSHGYPGQITS